MVPITALASANMDLTPLVMVCDMKNPVCSHEIPDLPKAAKRSTTKQPAQNILCDAEAFATLAQ